MNLSITSAISLPLIILMVGLAGRVATLRMRHKIGLGVASNKTLARAMGAHGNAVENIPVAILLIAIAELQSANTILLSVCGGLFIIGRGMNAYGVSRYSGQSFGRYYGTILSWFIMVSLAILNIWLSFF